MSESGESRPDNVEVTGPMIRPAATEEDKAIFDELLEKISTVDSYFCCGGTLELTDRPLALYYKSRTTGKTDVLDFSSEQSAQDRQIAINNLLEACVSAPHGRGDETIIDESYRLARELRQNEFALSIDIMGEVGSVILSSISALVTGRLVLTEEQASEAQKAQDFNAYYRSRGREPMVNPDKNTPSLLTMIPRLYKLNAYSKNGFFKSHRDTPKGNDHIGTLMIALPVPHQGGALRVNHDGKEVFFDWHQQCSEGVQAQEDKLKISLPWAFIFSDLEHEVLPVESGTRVTIAYDIFSPKATSSSKPAADIQVAPSVMNVMGNVDGTTTPLYNCLVAALRNPSFLTNGAEVAISLSHSYPMPRKAIKLTNEEFAASLKGIDAIVYRAMKAAGFDVSLKAVMVEETYDYKSAGIPKDGYDPVISSSESRYRSYTSTWAKFLITSDVFTSTHNRDLYVEERDYKHVVETEFGAQTSPQLMWVKKPEDTFVNAGAYLAYSNEHSVDFFYAAAAFILNVPPYGEGYRAFNS